MAENNKISSKARLDRAIDLKCRGLTDREISDHMKEEGYQWVSERTINKILNTVPEERVVEELKRLQLRTITTADVPLQLKYRDRLLEKMMPRRVEQVGSVKQEIDVKQNVSDEQLARFIPVIADMVMGEQTRRADHPDDQEDPQEPLDTPDTDP